VFRVTVDDFHPPNHGPRSAAGGYTVESYYAEGYDYNAIRQLSGPFKAFIEICRFKVASYRRHEFWIKWLKQSYQIFVSRNKMSSL
jgi:hypothetical protein